MYSIYCEASNTFLYTGTKIKAMPEAAMKNQILCQKYSSSDCPEVFYDL